MLLHALDDETIVTPRDNAPLAGPNGLTSETIVAPPVQFSRHDFDLRELFEREGISSIELHPDPTPGVLARTARYGSIDDLHRSQGIEAMMGA